MKRIIYSELVQRLNEKSRASVDKLLGDPKVDYLIVLQENSQSKPKILPAGPDLDFRNPKDAVGKVIRGMRAVAYVDLKAEALAESRTGSNGKAEGDEEKSIKQSLRELEAKIVWYENENHKLEQRFRKAKRMLSDKESKIYELTKRNEMLGARMDEYNCSDDEATEKRIKYVEESENELISRMDELLRKEAEIEQREDELLEKERDHAHP